AAATRAGSAQARRLAEGLTQSIRLKNRRTDAEAWGGWVGLLWMTGYWATLIPAWVYCNVVVLSTRLRGGAPSHRSRRVSSDTALTVSKACTTSRLAATLSGANPDSGTSLRYLASTSAHSIPRGAEPRGKSTWSENRRPSFSVIVTVAPWWCGKRSGYGGG